MPGKLSGKNVLTDFFDCFVCAEGFLRVDFFGIASEIDFKEEFSTHPFLSCLLALKIRSSVDFCFDL